MARIQRTQTDQIDLDSDELASLKAYLQETCSNLCLDSEVDLAQLVDHIDRWLRTAMPDVTEEM